MRKDFYETHKSLSTEKKPFSLLHQHIKQKKSGAAHWHKNVEFLHCTKGSGSVIISGVKYPFDEGDTVSVNPNEIHVVLTEYGVEYLCVIVLDEFCTYNAIDISARKLQARIHSEQVSAIFSDINSDQLCTEMPDTKKRIDILRLLYEMYSKYSTDSKTEIVQKSDIGSVIDYIYRHYSEDISLDMAAKMAGMSKGYFTKRFKSITGSTFVIFLDRVRCDSAYGMLVRGASVTEACYSCGFRDPAFFSRMFKKLHGVPPSAVSKASRSKRS